MKPLTYILLIWSTDGSSRFLSLSCRLMLAALVVLIMIAFCNYSALFFCCFATDYYGLWLQTYHRKDLACLRILVRHRALCFVYRWRIPRLSKMNCVPVCGVMIVLVEMFRSRMVWLSTLHGHPSPLWSTYRWFSTCGAWTGAQQRRLLCASCLERWWDGKL